MSEGEERHRAVMLNRNGSKPCEPSTSVTNRASSTIAKTEKRCIKMIEEAEAQFE